MSNSSTIELARRFVRALNEKDEAAIRQIYAPDARIWHNFDDKSQTVDENMRGMYACALHEATRCRALRRAGLEK